VNHYRLPDFDRALPDPGIDHDDPEVEAVIDHLDGYTVATLVEDHPELADMLEGVTDWKADLRADPGLLSQYQAWVPGVTEVVRAVRRRM